LYLKTVIADVPNINNMIAAELCAMDAINVSLHFQHKWNAIFSKLINHKNGIFSEVQTVLQEYQA